MVGVAGFELATPLHPMHFRFGFKWGGKKAWHYCGTWPATTLERIRVKGSRGKKQEHRVYCRRLPSGSSARFTR